MGCDMVVALGSASVWGQSLFGMNVHEASESAGLADSWRLRRIAGGCHALDEKVQLANLAIAQTKQTFAVAGVQAEHGWGLTQGVNEQRLAAGVARWTAKLAPAAAGLTGPELLRLVLERGRNVRQALEVLADLLTRHGLASRGNIFLFVDPHEAIVVEAAAHFWAAFECRQVRAVCDLAMIRQDWQRLAPGLAEHALGQQWWPDDGTKLDFAGSLQQAGPETWPLKRWGRATLMLEQQNGALDGFSLRGLLREHYAATAAASRTSSRLLSSTVVSLPAEQDALAPLWCCPGPLEHALYFPLFLEGDWPQAFADAEALARNCRPIGDLLKKRSKAQEIHERLQELQARFDQDVVDFSGEAASLSRQGSRSQVQRLASVLMQNHLELFQEESRRLQEHKHRPHAKPEPVAEIGQWF